MIHKFNYIIMMILLGFLLMGCTEKVPEKLDFNQLNRVDVEEVSQKKTVMITDSETIIQLRKIFEKIMWEEHEESERTGKGEFNATLFFKFDDNMPERLVVYQIWINQENGDVTIFEKDKEAYGFLSENNSKALKTILSSLF